jgi:hypothetical protein
MRNLKAPRKVAAKKKKTVTPRVPRTRNYGTETDSQHMGKIRAALRNISRWWKPFQVALRLASEKWNVGGRIKTMYKCCKCKRFLDRKSVEVNHIIPVGSLKTYVDLPGFCERLFVEDVSLLEVVCKECHLEITQEQRKKI